MAYSKADMAAYHRRWYASNRKKRIIQIGISNKKILSRNRAFVNSYLDQHPCVDCGEPDRIVLEFDHVRGNKSKEVSLLVNDGISIKRIAEEIEKCEVRCANCHRRVTVKRRQSKIGMPDNKE